MAQVRVLVLRAPGINCDEETAFAWESAGAAATRVHVNRLIERPALLGEFGIFTIPGGFSYGDDIASGRILGQQLQLGLADALRSFVDRGGYVFGICNGFQVLVRAGLLPGPDIGEPVSLTWNDSGRYEDRWVRVRVEASNCAILPVGEVFEFPVAHGEGRFVAATDSAMSAVRSRSRIALRYVGPHGSPAGFPHNPNGSMDDVAGLTDATGRILGLMPHPERNISRFHHPAWQTRPNTENDGLRFFRYAVQAAG